MESDPLISALSGSEPLINQAPVSQVIIIAGLILFFLLLSALFSSAEFGFYTLDRKERKKLTKSRRDLVIIDFLNNPGKFIATILVIKSILNAIVIILAVYLAYSLGIASIPPVLSVFLFVVVVSLAILVAGEFIPRIVGVRHSLAFSRTFALPLQFFGFIFYPLVALLNRSSSAVMKRYEKRSQKNAVEEISHALEQTVEDENTEDKEILEGIVNFGNKTVVEIMCPRVDVVTVDIRASFTEVLDLINTSGYSRIPVYSESFDQVKGILYIKDLLTYTEMGRDFNWLQLLRPPFFVPETKKVKDLLEDFQKNKIHMAVVVDEYGGSSGIVTMEDVLEEIVGDITDEFDEDEVYFSRIGEKKFLFDGKTPMEKFTEAVGADEDYFDDVKGEADTLAGLILEIRGEIPNPKEKIDFKEFRFIIESVSKRRIQQVQVEIE